MYLRRWHVQHKLWTMGKKQRWVKHLTEAFKRTSAEAISHVNLFSHNMTQCGSFKKNISGGVCDDNYSIYIWDYRSLINGWWLRWSDREHDRDGTWPLAWWCSYTIYIFNASTKRGELWPLGVYGLWFCDKRYLRSTFTWFTKRNIKFRTI